MERDEAVISACSGPGAGSDICKEKRAEAVLAQMSYEDGPYNSKYKDGYPDEYRHIQEILDFTTQKTQNQLAIRDAVAQNLAEKDNISLTDAYKKYDRYTATRDVIGIVGGTIGMVAVANRLPEETAPASQAGKGTTGKNEATVGNLEPGNPASTSIIRNGERLVLNQGSLPTCGVNSCAMVLDTAGIKYDLSKLMTDSKVGLSGARMTDLVTALKNQGLSDARFVSKTSLENISSATANGNPVIVAMKLDRGYHAVVVDGITMRNGQAVVAIRDPALGRQYFTPVNEFNQKYSGQAIFTNPKLK